MRSILEELSPKDKELLARFYDTEMYKALKRLLELERLNTATKLLDVSPDDVVSIARHQGRADECKQLNLTLRTNYKAHAKKLDGNED